MSENLYDFHVSSQRCLAEQFAGQSLFSARLNCFAQKVNPFIISSVDK